MSRPADPVLDALEPWLASGDPVVLAVSGGPDSTALMQAAALLGGSVHVATVDHGLRPESNREAERVGERARALGLPHAVLAWTGEKPASAIQARARAARYALLAEHARAVGAGLVLTAHTGDDQAETILLRLLDGSGPAGLAGMRAERPLGPEIRLGRPFLGLRKAALVALCDRHGLPYLQDPSNRDPRFTRARLRGLMPILEREGFSRARLLRLAERAARDEAALRAAAACALDVALGPSVMPDDNLRLDGAILMTHPEAVALRLVEAAMERAGAAGPRRLERLERLVLVELLPALRSGTPLRRTLRGLAIAADARGAVTLRQAPARRNARGADKHSELLGKGESATYIGEECAEEPAGSGAPPGAGGPHSPGIGR